MRVWTFDVLEQSLGREMAVRIEEEKIESDQPQEMGLRRKDAEVWEYRVHVIDKLSLMVDNRAPLRIKTMVQFPEQKDLMTVLGRAFSQNVWTEVRREKR